MTKNTTITIQIPVALKKKAVRKAKKEGMSMSYYIRHVIREATNNG